MIIRYINIFQHCCFQFLSLEKLNAYLKLWCHMLEKFKPHWHSKEKIWVIDVNFQLLLSFSL